MIVLDVPQGSREWFDARLGVVTASNADNIVTPTGKAVTGAKRETYMRQLLTEKFTGIPHGGVETFAMRRGTELEPKARQWYEIATGRDVKRVGFVWRNESRDCGCSPDGLSDGRGLEIKCPLAHTLVGYMLDGGGVPAQYVIQVQFCMWVTGLDEWDFVLYSDCEGIPSTIQTVAADAKIHHIMDEAVPTFVSDMARAEIRLKEMGAKAALRIDDIPQGSRNIPF